jgi:hypothetical protein
LAPRLETFALLASAELATDPIAEDVALDELVEELELLEPVLDCTLVLVPLTLVLAVPDMPPPRLPRSRGASRAAKRSAEIVPLRRIVWCRSPKPTATVRMLAAADFAFPAAWR